MDKRGGARPGAGRPPGEPNARTREFAIACRAYLEHKTDSIPRFRRIADSLLRPIIESKRDRNGEEIPGTEYLVNAASMLGTFELLAGYAYGRPRQQVEHSGEITSKVHHVLEVPAGETRAEWLARHAAIAAELEKHEAVN